MYYFSYSLDMSLYKIVKGMLDKGVTTIDTLTVGTGVRKMKDVQEIIGILDVNVGNLLMKLVNQGVNTVLRLWVTVYTTKIATVKEGAILKIV